MKWPQGDYEELMEYLQDLKQEYGKYKTWNLDYFWRGHKDCIYKVDFTRYENEEELDFRIKQEEEQLLEWQQKYAEVVIKPMNNEDKAKNERRLQYEKLKKEFGE